MKNTHKFILACLCTFSVQISHADKVDDLMEVMHIKSQMIRGFDAMQPTIDMQVKQLSLNEAQTEELTRIYKEWFENDYEQEKVFEEAKNIYRKAFTDEELDDLITFYKMPIGEKFAITFPQIMQANTINSMKEGQRSQAILREKAKPFLEKLNKGSE